MKKYREPIEKSVGAVSNKPKPKKTFKIMWRSARWNVPPDEEKCLDPTKEEFWDKWTVFKSYSTEARRDQALEKLPKNDNHGFHRAIWQYAKEEDI